MTGLRLTFYMRILPTRVASGPSLAQSGGFLINFCTEPKEREGLDDCISPGALGVDMLNGCVQLKGWPEVPYQVTLQWTPGGRPDMLDGLDTELQMTDQCC